MGVSRGQPRVPLTLTLSAPRGYPGERGMTEPTSTSVTPIGWGNLHSIQKDQKKQGQRCTRIGWSQAWAGCLRSEGKMSSGFFPVTLR